VGQFVVAQAASGVFGGDEFAQDVFDAEGAVEEVGQGDQAAIGEQGVFVGGGAADGAFVQVEAHGDLGAGEGAQVADTFV